VGNLEPILPNDTVRSFANDVLNIILLADIEGDFAGTAPVLCVTHGGARGSEANKAYCTSFAVEADLQSGMEARVEKGDNSARYQTSRRSPNAVPGGSGRIVLLSVCEMEARLRDGRSAKEAWCVWDGGDRC